MSSSSGEELDELLRRQVMRQRRNFEERRLFHIKNQIQGNFEVSSPCGRLRSPFGINRPAFGT